MQAKDRDIRVGLGGGTIDVCKRTSILVIAGLIYATDEVAACSDSTHPIPTVLPGLASW